MNHEVIKPCPFCGGDAEVSLVLNSDGMYTIGCYNDGCGCDIPDYGSKSLAVSAWNRRDQSPKEVAEAPWDDPE